MERARRSIEAALAVAFAACVAAPAAMSASQAVPEDAAPARPRITIRGSGNDVKIDRTADARASKSFSTASPSSTALTEAIRRKAQGGTDDAVVSYLRAHAGELPAIVDVTSVRSLRRAGASDTLFAYLATVAAIDIGPTGERSAEAEPAAVSEAAYPSGSEAPDAFEPSTGYPFYGTVGGGVPAGARRHSMRRPPGRSVLLGRTGLPRAGFGAPRMIPPPLAPPRRRIPQ